MLKKTGILENSPLFEGITAANLKLLLDCLSARQKFFAKNSYIFMSGSKTDSLGIILGGAVIIVREDFWGKRLIVSRTEAGGIFGEAFACAGTELPISVMAAEDSDILLIKCKRIINPCSPSCSYHTELNRNLTMLLAKKNIGLLEKMDYITRPTTREKLLAYLSVQAGLAGTHAFNIPFNREELADYLSVERSAMSAELSKMKKEGLINYEKNHFELNRSDNPAAG